MFHRWIIFEPSIFLFLASVRFVYFTRQNLFIHVVCRHMSNLTEAECANLTPENRDLVDTHAADHLSNIIMPEHVGPIFLCLVSAPFSDGYGRKLPLVSSAGMTAAYVGYGLLNLFDSDFTIDPRLYLLPSLGISLGGQFFVSFLDVLCLNQRLLQLREGGGHEVHQVPHGSGICLFRGCRRILCWRYWQYS